MLKKTVTYKDFDGKEYTDDFYFNLTEAECTELLAENNGNLINLLEKIVSEQRSDKLIEYFKKLVLMAYGEKTIDSKGRTIHLKNDRIREEFLCSAAYSKIFMELANDDKAASDFVNGIIPSDMGEDSKVKALPGKAPVVVETPQA